MGDDGQPAVVQAPDGELLDLLAQLAIPLPVSNTVDSCGMRAFRSTPRPPARSAMAEDTRTALSMAVSTAEPNELRISMLLVAHVIESAAFDRSSLPSRFEVCRDSDAAAGPKPVAARCPRNFDRRDTFDAAAQACCTVHDAQAAQPAQYIEEGDSRRIRVPSRLASQRWPPPNVYRITNDSSGTDEAAGIAGKPSGSGART